MTPPLTLLTSSEGCTKHGFFMGFAQIYANSPALQVFEHTKLRPTRTNWHVAAILFTQLNIFEDQIVMSNKAPSVI